MPITYDRKDFFNAVRASVFGGWLSGSQVAGMSAILDGWEKLQPNGDTRFIAYMLGTAYWETDHTMQPIKEHGDQAYCTRMYDITGERPSVARALGNTQPGDGARFCGRGLPQTTGRKNYAWASTVIGQDCLANPDLLLDPQWACKVMFEAMLEGKYTGKKLADYFNAGTDWVDARRIINGTDHAADIAGIAERFFAALKHAMVYAKTMPAGAAGPSAQPSPVPAPPPPRAPAKPTHGMFSVLDQIGRYLTRR